MSWTITPQQKNKGLLDEFLGAAAAYSLRDLSVLRNAPVVRVRRSSDNAEQDFTATQVTNGTLTTFCGAGDGFVRTWYDQTLNGRHARQTTAADQPRIVSSGSLSTENTKPSIDFSVGNGLEILPTALNGATDYSLLSVCNFKNADVFEQLFSHSDGTSSPNRIELRRNSNNNSVQYLDASSSGFTGSETIDNKQILIVLNRSGNIATGYINNAQDGTKTENATAIGVYRSFIGVRFGTGVGIQFAFRGAIQELIVYATSQSSNRIAIQNNINAHYAIY